MSVASEQQHNQDLKLKKYVKGSTNSRIHDFLTEYIAFNQSALCHEQHEDVAWISMRICSDLLVRRCAGNVIDFHNYVISLQSRLRGRILKSDEEKSSLLKLVES